MSSAHIGQRIREFRKSRGLTLEALANKSGITISTASKLERPDANYNISDALLTKIAAALGTTIEILHRGTTAYRVGFGGTLWASPLLRMVDPKFPHPNVCLAFTHTDGKPDFFPPLPVGATRLPNTLSSPTGGALSDSRSAEKNLSSGAGQLYTANELITGLKSHFFDMIFIPALAYDPLENTFTRVASIMNTVKGGLYLLSASTFAKAPTAIEYFSQRRNTTASLFMTENSSATTSKSWGHGTYQLFFTEGTISEYASQRLRVGKRFVTTDPVSSTNPTEFFNQIFDAIHQSDSERDYVGYIGWEPHISNLEFYLQNRSEGRLKIHRECLYQIFDEDEKNDGKETEAFLVTFDAFVTNEHSDVLANNPDVRQFFSALNNSILQLNRNKGDDGVQHYHRSIGAQLNVSPDVVRRELNQISFDLSFPLNALLKS